MNKTQVEKRRIRKSRALRTRKKINGTADRPRMCAIKSNSHIYVQLIDDVNGSTLGSLTTCCKEFKSGEFGRKNKASARMLGKRIAEIAKEKNIKEVVFDRGQFKYHGVLAELADGAREAGLKI